MKLDISQDPETSCDIYTLRVHLYDCLFVKLRPEDRQVLIECEKSELISDKLFGLYVLAKRVEEYPK